MSVKDFCGEHEQLKACARGVITWPKFITIIISIIMVIIGVTTTISTFLYGEINKVGDKAIAKADTVEQSSIIRDKEVTIQLKDTMEKYIVPISLSVARIEEKLKK